MRRLYIAVEWPTWQMEILRKQKMILRRCLLFSSLALHIKILGIHFLNLPVDAPRWWKLTSPLNLMQRQRFKNWSRRNRFWLNPKILYIYLLFENRDIIGSLIFHIFLSDFHLLSRNLRRRPVNNLKDYSTRSQGKLQMLELKIQKKEVQVKIKIRGKMIRRIQMGLRKRHCFKMQPTRLE